MNARRSMLWMMSLTMAGAGLTLGLYSRLPNRVPIHWNIHGQADGFAGRSGAWMLPAFMLGMLVLAFALPALSPKQYRIDAFRDSYWKVMVWIQGLFLYLHSISLWAAMSPQVDSGRWVVSGLMFFMAAVGNLMGKVKRNFWMGYRTPWTLANEQVWIATHRLAAHMMVGSGVLGGLWVVAGLPIAWAFAGFMLALLWPCVYSYLLYRRIEQAGSTT